jgi:hypothetical protein
MVVVVRLFDNDEFTDLKLVIQREFVVNSGPYTNEVSFSKQKQLHLDGKHTQF